MAKYYAVKRGKSTGLFNNWAECQEAIKGYSGAEYKSFTDEKTALLYLMGEEVKPKATVKSDIQKLTREDECNVFASGSYEKDASKCNLAIIIKNVIGTRTYLCCVLDEFCDKQKTIAAEILSAYIGLKLAVDLGYKNINLYSNYEGIKRWAEKDWAAKNEVVSNFVRCIKENSKSGRICVYQLKECDKEVKKDLKYYVGYASSTHHQILLPQIFNDAMLGETLEEYDD